MVSHMLIVVDGDHGTGAVIERAPEREPYVHMLGNMAGISNHYTSPVLAADPKNQSVREHTSTLAREERLQELVHEFDGRFDPLVMQQVLRDRRGPGDVTEPLGHRGTLDAWIATHSVVADATARVLWVSDSPHALGRYERFDLRRLLADDYQPSDDVDGAVLPPDAALSNGASILRWLSARALIDVATVRLGHHDAAGALAAVDRALEELPERDMDALRVRARALSAGSVRAIGRSRHGRSFSRRIPPHRQRRRKRGRQLRRFRHGDGARNARDDSVVDGGNAGGFGRRAGAGCAGGCDTSTDRSGTAGRADDRSAVRRRAGHGAFCANAPRARAARGADARPSAMADRGAEPGRVRGQRRACGVSVGRFQQSGSASQEPGGSARRGASAISRHFLGGSLQSLAQQRYTIDVASGPNGSVVLTAVPHDSQIHNVISSVRIQFGSDLRVIEAIDLNEPSGDHTHIAVRGTQINSGHVPADSFAP